MLARDLTRSPIAVDADLIEPTSLHLARTGGTFKALVQEELGRLCDEDRPLPSALAGGADPAGRLRRDGTVSSRIGRPITGDDPMPAAKKRTSSKAPKKTPPKKAAAKKPAAKKTTAKKSAPAKKPDVGSDDED